jgi:hypothetical protein
MVSQKVSYCAIVLMGCLLAGQSHGRTWFVERDGSGDFAVIQDAVNAASSGDEIRIGPGRYAEFSQYSWGKTVVYVEGKNLTLVGSGVEATLIGPATYIENYDEYGIACRPGDVSIRIEGICFQNLNYKGVSSRANEVIIRSCLFDHCYTGASASSGASILFVEDCRFENGAGIFSSGVMAQVPHVSIERSTFNSYAGGIDVNYNGATDVVIRDCTFTGGELGQIGVNVTMGSGAMIENCSFQGHSLYGLAYNNAGSLVFRDNVVESSGGSGCVTVGPAEHVVIEDNIFIGGHRSFFLREDSGPHEIHRNHIFRDESIGGYYIEAASDWIWDSMRFDFTGNYWGSTDTDYISEWILDGNDMPGVTLFVEFLPIADGPVQTESTTWGAVKSLFR